ncbi:MAG: sodium:proton antiporter [Gammaproteobacteria bacterium]|nr:sodium:proton antiporter [Gammaproteobacteria bacterium]
MELSAVLAGLVLLGFGCQWLAWRTRLPAILFLLISGLLLGPVTGLIDPQQIFGEMFFPMVEIGVAIILFEGSLTLRFREIRSFAPAIVLLVTVGAAIAVAGLAAAAHHLAGLPWPVALLFGAINCVSGPTVIIPLLRAVRPNARIAQVLRWEGIIIDPIGAMLALLAFEAIVLGSQQHTGELLLLTVGAGTALGLAAGFAIAELLRRQWVPEFLDNFLVLAAVVGTYAISNLCAEESGLLAVTVMGITMANIRNLDVEHILNFKENLSIFLISMMFIVLSARIEWPSADNFLAGLAILAVATLVIRPLSVYVSTLFSPLKFAERTMVAYVSPRGIVAAAVSALFALRLEEQGISGANELVALTFMIIIGTVVLQSVTAARVARWLDVVQPQSRGVLIVGSSELPRLLAQALQKQEIPVLVADDDWQGISQCRMTGIPTYFGNPVSEHAEATLPLSSMRWLLAMSTRIEMNSLACRAIAAISPRTTCCACAFSAPARHRASPMPRHCRHRPFLPRELPTR